MPKKYLKECSLSLAIRTKKIKAWRFHLIPMRIENINKTMDSKSWRSVGKRNPHSLLVGFQIGSAREILWKSVRENPLKPKKEIFHMAQLYHCLTYAQGACHPPPQELVNPLFITALVAIARKLKQSKCLSIDD